MSKPDLRKKHIAFEIANLESARAVMDRWSEYRDQPIYVHLVQVYVERLGTPADRARLAKLQQERQGE